MCWDLSYLCSFGPVEVISGSVAYRHSCCLMNEQTLFLEQSVNVEVNDRLSGQ
jgi:hypothetical protein